MRARAVENVNGAGGVILTSVLLFAFALALYATRLETRDLTREEMEIASAASALAANDLRDADGRFMPLFVRSASGNGLPPLPVYAAAVSQRVWWMSPTRIRWVAALTGAVNLVLLYILARRVFGSAALAAVASILLLLTPAYVTYSRSVTQDGVWQLPFVTAWLIGFAAFAERSTAPRHWQLAAAVAALGAAIYSAPSAAIMVVILLALTAWIGWRFGIRRNAFLWAGVALFLTLSPAFVWLLRHPAMYADTFGSWLVHPAHIRNPIDWLTTLTNWESLTVIVDVFWDFFSPSHLFVNDQSPGMAGVFLLPMIVPMIVGARETLRAKPGGAGRRVVLVIALYGFVLAGLIGATFKEPRAIQRALVVAIFGALLATRGFQSLSDSKTFGARLMVTVLFAAALVQFFAWYSHAMLAANPT